MPKLPEVTAKPGGQIATMQQEAIDKIRAVEAKMKELPQIDIATKHLIHAGIYSRTVVIPGGAAITGVLVKRSTILNITGDVIVYTGGEPIHFLGNNVVACSPNRKQAFMALDETTLTMSFATDAKTVEEAEAEFTDETDLLVSRHSENQTIITGE